MTFLLNSAIVALFLRASATALSVEDRASAPTTFCNVSKFTPDVAPVRFPPPSFPTSFIGLGVGTQNWTCFEPEGIWANQGTTTEIFDISCLAGTAAFDSISQTAFAAWNASSVTNVADAGSVLSAAKVLENPFTLGQSFQVTDPLQTRETSPIVDFAQSLKNSQAFVIGDIVGDALDPNAPLNPDVNFNWFLFNGAEGTLAQQVYILNTFGGQAPVSCAGPSGASLILKYASVFWLQGSSFSA